MIERSSIPLVYSSSGCNGLDRARSFFRASVAYHELLLLGFQGGSSRSAANLGQAAQGSR